MIIGHPTTFPVPRQTLLFDHAQRPWALSSNSVLKNYAQAVRIAKGEKRIYSEWIDKDRPWYHIIHEFLNGVCVCLHVCV